jgi:flagellar biogenesis protein FliO
MINCALLIYKPTLFLIAQIEPASFSDALTRVVLATILFVFVGFGIAVWISRRHSTSKSPTSRKTIARFLHGGMTAEAGASLEVVQRLRVGPSQNLLHVNWLGEDLLIGCTPQTLNLLHSSKRDEVSGATDSGTGIS